MPPLGLASRRSRLGSECQTCKTSIAHALVHPTSTQPPPRWRSGERPNPDRALLNASLSIEIERALDTLTPREADVIRLYFGLESKQALTLEEIGERFDLTRERVRQIKEKAIRRLKHASRSKILKTYLG